MNIYQLIIMILLMEKIKSEKDRQIIENILNSVILSLQSDLRFINLFMN
jgi:hypothetical protein